MKYFWLHPLNFVFLQWFGVRLARISENGNFVRWTLIFVRPLSGYFGQPFIYWGLSLEGLKSTDIAAYGRYARENYMPTDHEINKAVAIALGYRFTEDQNSILVTHNYEVFGFAPTQSWKQAGKIIEQQNISLMHTGNKPNPCRGICQNYVVEDRSPLRAMMRAYAKI